jgi:sugar lactone lactonase YvrE
VSNSRNNMKFWSSTAVAAVAGSVLIGLTSASHQPSFAAGAPERLAVVNDVGDAEAVVYDPRTDSYFVSDVHGNPGVKDGNGSIVRISGEGKLQDRHFIQGGKKGVTLNAPMGSRVRGDTLWVLDVDILRGFDTRSGAPIASVDLAPAGALFLNDFDFGPDGSMYVTDMRLRVGANGDMAPTGPGRIYQIGRDHRVRVALENAALTFPDGLGWDASGKRVIIAPFNDNPVQQWRPGKPAPEPLAKGKGRFDGVEVERDGSILITSWNDSTVSTLEGTRLAHRLGPLSMTPADVSLDVRRSRVGVVSMEAGRFELWTWGK